MAGAGKKTFTSGEVLTASDVNGYLMDQAVMRFADSSARGSAIAAPSEGMLTYLDDTNNVEVYDGSSWSAIRNAHAIAAVAGTATINLASTALAPTVGTINWPSGRFSVAPVTVVTNRTNATGGYHLIFSPLTEGTASQLVAIANAAPSGTATECEFYAVAVQMTAGSATG